LATALPSGAMAQDTNAPSASPSPDTGATNGDESLNLPAVPPVELRAFVDLAQGYSTNAQAGGSGGGEGDTFTRGRVGVNFHYDKPRLFADLGYILTGSYWAKFHKLNHLSNRLNLASRLIAIPDMLFISANAFASPADLTRPGARSASGEPISRYNTRDTYGYMVRPEFILHFKDYLTNTLSGSQGGVFFVTPSTSTTSPPPPIVPAQNSLSTSVSDQLASGSYFERLRFELLGSYSQFSETVRTQRETQGLLSLYYSVTRYLTIFGSGGYSDFRSTQHLAKDLSGPTGIGGITLSDTPDFVLTLEAGTQNNFPTYLGMLHWSISPLTHLIINATNGINTPQGEILARLSQTGSYGDGNFNDMGTGLGTVPTNGYAPFPPGGLALDNSLNRVQSIEGNLVHTDEINTFTVGAFANARDRLDVPPGQPITRTSVYGFRGAASRKLGTDTTATLSATYSLGNEFGGHDRVFYGDAHINHRLSETLDLYLTNHYTRRDSKNQTGFTSTAVSEDQVILGIRANF
jgi:hypothetical protein